MNHPTVTGLIRKMNMKMIMLIVWITIQQQFSIIEDG